MARSRAVTVISIVARSGVSVVDVGRDESCVEGGCGSALRNGGVRAYVVLRVRDELDGVAMRHLEDALSRWL